MMVGPNQMTWEQAVLWLKDQPDRQELVQACYFDDPLIDAAQRFYGSTEWQAVQRLLRRPAGRALEVGAGRGIASYALARDGWSVCALEPDPSDEIGSGAIKRLSRDSKIPIEVVSEWGETLPFNDASFDLVYCRAVLHHARDLGTFCTEVGRVLRPGGTLLATREHVLSHTKDIDKFLASHPLHSLYGGENAFLRNDYISAIQSGGMRVAKVLNPLSSDINLFPDTVEGVKKRWSKKLRIPSVGLVPTLALRLAGECLQRPGRLYSFLAFKD